MELDSSGPDQTPQSSTAPLASHCALCPAARSVSALAESKRKPHTSLGVSIASSDARKAVITLRGLIGLFKRREPDCVKGSSVEAQVKETQRVSTAQESCCVLKSSAYALKVVLGHFRDRRDKAQIPHRASPRLPVRAESRVAEMAGDRRARRATDSMSHNPHGALLSASDGRWLQLVTILKHSYEVFSSSWLCCFSLPRHYIFEASTFTPQLSFDIFSHELLCRSYQLLHHRQSSTFLRAQFFLLAAIFKIILVVTEMLWLISALTIYIHYWLKVFEHQNVPIF